MLVRLMPLLFLFALAGCAPFAVNWYHDPGVEPSSRDDVQLAVLNRGDRACRVSGLWMNRLPDGSAFRWEPLQPRTLLPGQLLVVPLGQFRWVPTAQAPTVASAGRDAGCTLPLTVGVQASSCSWREQDEFRVDLARSLPNALPESWSSCLPPRASDARPP